MVVAFNIKIIKNKKFQPVGKDLKILLWKLDFCQDTKILIFLVNESLRNYDVW